MYEIASLRSGWQYKFGQPHWVAPTRWWQIFRVCKKRHLHTLQMRITAGCETCDTIQGIHNQVWSCRECNFSKGTKGLYEFFRDKLPNERKYYDLIPPLLEKKYLKTIYNCHICAETIDKGDLDGDGEITVLDIDHILHWGTRIKNLELWSAFVHR